MIKKKDIIKYLESKGFEKRDSYLDCYNFPERCYFVEVNRRSKLFWTHVFINPKNDERLEFNMYFMFHVTPQGTYTLKLNKENEDLIEKLINNVFLRK